MLLEHLEEEFDLPAVPIDFADGSCAEGKVVGQKLGLPLVLFVPDYHSAQQAWILETGLGPGKADDLVGEDAPALRQGAILYDLVSGVAFEPGNEVDTRVSPLKEKFEVTIAPIHSYNAASGKREIAGSGYVGSFAIGDHGEVRQIAVVIQEHVEFNGAFGLAEVGPRKQAQTKVDGGGVEAEQLVLEAKLLLFARALATAEIPQMKECVLIKLPGAVGVGIRKRALGGSGTQSQMAEFAAGDGQTVADLTQALGLSQLAKEHGDTLVPGGEAFGVAFRPTFIDQPQKRIPGQNLENLAEQTCGKLHSRDSFEVFWRWVVLSPYYFLESLLYCSARKPILDKSDLMS